VLLAGWLGLSGCGDKGEEVEDDDVGEDPITDQDGDGYDAEAFGGNDCDDTDPDINISGIEVCNDKDDDCDGEVDEDPADGTSFYADADGDGHGLLTETIDACDQPSGYSSTSTDCDDTEAAVNPDASEDCDGVDTNCDGTVGEDEVDGDGDGFPGCEPADHGWLGGEDYTEGDCDDSDEDIYPGAEEVCDGADTDCDGELLDEEADLDGDGYDVCRYDDCDDDDADVSPGATEDCTDLADQDCDDLIDCSDPDCDEDPACEEDCTNGDDDDADGLVDCEDGECADHSSCVEDCEDGVDNDVDGLTDCEDVQDCGGTATCPVTRQITLNSGNMFAYGFDYYGRQYMVLVGYSLSGTVGTFDSSASSWKSCAWSVGSAYDYTATAGGSIWGTHTFNLRRDTTSVTGSCDYTRARSFLPGSVFVQANTTPRVARIATTTAFGQVNPTWYSASRTYSYNGIYQYWLMYGGLGSQVLWD